MIFLYRVCVPPSCNPPLRLTQHTAVTHSSLAINTSLFPNTNTHPSHPLPPSHSLTLCPHTNTQNLWVGPGSRAARDKAAFEASFGPFYRVSQIIIHTTPSSVSNFTNPTSGLPSIVTDTNIRMLFDMQYLVDSLKGGLCGIG